MSLKAAKIGIVGAGNVGATLAYGLMLLRIGVTIVLFDRTLSKAEGEAWDIEDAIPLCADLDAGWINCHQIKSETLVLSLQPPSNEFGANGKSSLQ